jgi:hypothetical protein
MSCATRFFGIPMGRHHWRREVVHTEIITAQEPDMWARTVYRDYVRCDTRKVCATCGAIKHERSCLCDQSRGDACTIRLELLKNTRSPAP